MTTDNRNKHKLKPKSTQLIPVDPKNPVLTTPPCNNQNHSGNTTPIIQPNSTKTHENTDNEEIQSVFEWNEFPAKTRPIKFTPKQLKIALEHYSNTTTPIDQVLKKHQVNINTFFVLLGRYPEINETYLMAQHQKSRKYGEESLAQWERLPDDPVFYQHDREGHKFLTTAAVQYMDKKATAMLRFAQIHETGSYIPLSKQETINKNLNLGVNLTGKLPKDFDLSSASPDDLVLVLRGKK